MLFSIIQFFGLQIWALVHNEVFILQQMRTQHLWKWNTWSLTSPFRSSRSRCPCCSWSSSRSRWTQNTRSSTRTWLSLLSKRFDPFSYEGGRQVWCHLDGIWGWSMEYGQNIYGKYYLELDNTLDILAISIVFLSWEVNRLPNGQGDRLLGLAGGTSEIWDR